MNYIISHLKIVHLIEAEIRVAPQINRERVDTGPHGRGESQGELLGLGERGHEDRRRQQGQALAIAYVDPPVLLLDLREVRGVHLVRRDAAALEEPVAFRQPLLELVPLGVVVADLRVLALALLALFGRWALVRAALVVAAVALGALALARVRACDRGHALEVHYFVIPG